MPGKHLILCLDELQYELRGGNLSRIVGVQGLAGDKRVFSDFEAAVPQIAALDSHGKYAHAVLDKQLREAGEIEPGGRLVVLLARRRGQRTTELLYITTPALHGAESELEREHEQDEYLLFPVQQLLADTLVALKPRYAIAIMLVSERQIDVLVADRRALYATFRMSMLSADVDPVRLSQNLEQALQRVERDSSITIRGFHRLCLLTPADVDLGWIEASAKARGVACETPRLTGVKVDGAAYLSSALERLRGMGAAKSCSPRPVVGNYYANRMLPWVATALAACCVAALVVLIRQQHATRQLTGEIAARSATLNSRIVARPASVPDYRAYLDTAAQLAHARSIPTLAQVLADVAGAARAKATAFDNMQIEYRDHDVVVTLKGRTDKSAGGNSMALYDQFVANLRSRHYVLAQSELDTQTRQIAFSLRLTRAVAGDSA